MIAHQVAHHCIVLQYNAALVLAKYASFHEMPQRFLQVVCCGFAA